MPPPSRRSGATTSLAPKRAKTRGSSARFPRAVGDKTHETPTSSSVWGRTQYTLYTQRPAHASAGMKCEPPMTPTSPLAPTTPTYQPKRARTELFACFETASSSSSTTPPRPALQPVTVEGFGRMVLHSDLLPAPPASLCASDKAPTTTPGPSSDALERRALVLQWLHGDDEDEDEVPSSTTYHPMVAKCLRERSRRYASTSLHTSAAQDMWIGLDGHRRPRGTKRPHPRRVASTMQSLQASGLSPVMGCHCGFTDKHMGMVQCDGCQRWLHLACVGVSHVDQLPPTDWVCDDCYESRAALSHAPSPTTARPAPMLAAWPSQPWTLSLAPSPSRMLDDDWMPSSSVAASPVWSRHVSMSSDAAHASSPARPCRTPSPPPAPFANAMTPSRHFTPYTNAEWLPTPTGLLAYTPHSAWRTPSNRGRAMYAPDSPTHSTYGARRAALSTPSDATPSFASDLTTDGVRLSSPMPDTPTGPSSKTRVLNMHLASPSPKTRTRPGVASPRWPGPMAWRCDE